MKRAAIGTLLLLCCVVSLACAEPPSLPPGAPVYIKVVNLEQVNPANNLAVPGYAAAAGQHGGWGVLNVLTLQHGVVTTPNVDIGAGGGAIFFADDGPGGSEGQITAIVYGMQNTSATTSTGGTIDFFWHSPSATYITGACSSGATCAPDAAAVALFTSGTFLARVKLASGIDGRNAQTFTRRSGAVTDGGVSQADSFAEVDTTMTGPWTAALNGNWFTTSFGPRDVRLSTTVIPLASWSVGPVGTVGLRSNDPIRVFTH